MFRTPVTITPSDNFISLKSDIITAGSCFSDAIGNKLIRYKFKTLANPFGTLYNPLSIHKTLEYSIIKKSFENNSFLINNDIHLNYHLHSQFSALTRKELNDKINDTFTTTRESLKNANWLLLTYGTAWVYTHNDLKEVVANCHKIPATQFIKSLLHENEIIDSFNAFYKILLAHNPNIRIILTVSPVRHIKDTLELNSVSKALLRMICHKLSESFTNVEYFPAYEMMMDDLRDYRFYKSDMIHPTEDAEDYIWKNFIDRYMDTNSKEFIKKWNYILSALQHKPFHIQSASHQHFIKETLKRLNEFKSLVDVSGETAALESQLV